LRIHFNRYSLLYSSAAATTQEDLQVCIPAFVSDNPGLGWLCKVYCNFSNSCKYTVAYTF